MNDDRLMDMIKELVETIRSQRDISVSIFISADMNVSVNLWSIIAIGANHGKPQTGNYNVYIAAGVTAVVFAILIWGGFFGGEG